MPHHRNGRTGRDGVVRAEPGASAPAWLARRQADHGRRWGNLLTWGCGEVASVIQCAVLYREGVQVHVFLYVLYCVPPHSYLPTFVLTALHFSDAGLLSYSSTRIERSHPATSSYDLGGEGSNSDLNPYLFVSLKQSGL